MALGSFLGPGEAGAVQQGVVGPAGEIPGRGAAAGAHGSGFRSRREVSRAGECAVHAVFSGADLPVPVSARAMQGSRGGGAAASLLDLREQKGRRKVERHAVHGHKQALAGCDGNDDGAAGSGCHGAGGLFCAAEDVAGRAEQEEGRGWGGGGGKVFSVVCFVVWGGGGGGGVWGGGGVDRSGGGEILVEN